ncbi:MAG: hypothetical protein NUV82_00185 [Candidatus Komeilibacteria bacterium]|nr:hypothetical protein [Candidatus Komeilibacteria bacterium]
MPILNKLARSYFFPFFLAFFTAGFFAAFFLAAIDTTSSLSSFAQSDECRWSPLPREIDVTGRCDSSVDKRLP